MGRALLLVVLAGLLAPAVRAGEEPPPALPEAAVQVEAWIKDLASEQYEVREEARKGLERRGREAPDVLRAHADDADPEVRRTVRGLIERLGSSITPAPAAASADVARVGLVRLHATRRPLGEVLDELGTALGGSFVVDPASAKKPVSLDVEDMPYFAAVEALAEAAGLRAASAFDGEGRLAFTPVPDRPGSASATLGPLRLKAARVTAARTLDGSDVRTHTVTLDLHLAPCVQLVNHRTTRVVKALDPAGRAWRTAGNPTASMIHGVGLDVRRVELHVALEPTDGAEERLAVLEVAVPVRLRHERRAVRFASVADLPRTLSEQGKPAEAGAKGTVTLSSVAPAEERKDAWLVDLSAVPSTPSGRESLDAFLLTADGAKRRLWIAGSRSTTSADGRLRLVGRCYGTGESQPVAVEVAWFEREGEGEATFVLKDVPLR